MPLQKSEVSERLKSLDTLRGLAIILVILYHYRGFISHQNNFGIISQIGWVGVDLFFVLSGYLISSHIFTEINTKRFSLKTFYLKRIFKTLPNYYIVLLLYVCIPYFAEKPIIEPLWKYILFIQNFNLTGGGFTQSWSLCIEEQFYLFFPLLVLFLFKFNKKVFISILFVIIVIEIILRGSLWQHLVSTNNLKNYPTTIYYPTYCRLDGFICGIMVAYIQTYLQSLWQKVSDYANILLLVGIITLCSFIVIVLNITSFLSTTIGYTGIPLSFAIIVFSGLSHKSILNKYYSATLSKIAKWSYAIYLIQKPISVLIANYFTKLGLDNNSYTVILINIICQILAGYLLYYLVERRFMLLRNKVLKT